VTGKPRPTEPEFVEGTVMDEDLDEGLPYSKVPTPVVPKPVKSKAAKHTPKPVVAAPAPTPAPVSRATPDPEHDDRGQRFTWINRASRPAPLDGALVNATAWEVLDWAKAMPAIIPRPDGTFTKTQTTVLTSLQHRAASVHGFIRAYRRVTLPSGVFATLWIGPAQTSNLDTCIIARIPASRMPVNVNEFTLATAAVQGWSAVVKGWPNYRLDTKYLVGQDRMVPWELEPAEVLDIQVPTAGAPGDMIRFTRGAE
jgi:hypothetical protein